MEVLELLAGRSNEHIAHKEGVVGTSANNPHIDPVAVVPAGESINDINAGASVQIVDCALAVDLPNLYPSKAISTS